MACLIENAIKEAIQQKRKEERMRLANGINVIQRNKEQAWEHRPDIKLEHITHRRVRFALYFKNGLIK